MVDPISELSVSFLMELLSDPDAVMYKYDLHGALNIGNEHNLHQLAYTMGPEYELHESPFNEEDSGYKCSDIIEWLVKIHTAQRLIACLNDFDPVD